MADCEPSADTPSATRPASSEAARSCALGSSSLLSANEDRGRREWEIAEFCRRADVAEARAASLERNIEDLWMALRVLEARIGGRPQV